MKNEDSYLHTVSLCFKQPTPVGCILYGCIEYSLYFQDVIIQCDRGVASISLNPVFSYQLAAGCSDGCVR